MSHPPASDEMARQLRTAWFTYVDTIESVRPALYRYCRRLTGDVWEAEDLLQETLLRGFGAIGRRDLHGESSRVKDTRAYLFRVATNLWIDQLRRNEVGFGRSDVPAPSPTPKRQSQRVKRLRSCLLRPRRSSARPWCSRTFSILAPKKLP